MHLSVLALCATLYSTLASAQTLITTGRTLLLNDIHYYVPPTAVGKIPEWQNTGSFDELVPVTVINHNTTSFGSNDLEQVKEVFLRKDDVFQLGFLQGSFLSPRLGCQDY